MFCPKCNNQLDDNAKFCNVCGTSLQDPAPQPVEPQDVVPQDAAAPQPAPQGNGTQPVVEKAKAFIANVPALFKDLVDNFPAYLNRFMNNKPLFFGAIGGVAALILVIVLIASLTGTTYKTPIAETVDALNSKKYVDSYDQIVDHLNGFTAGEFKAIFKILKSTDDYKDNLEDRKDAFEDSIQSRKDEYGDNYKYSYKITDKEKLDSDDLKEVKDQIHEAGKKMRDFVKETKDDDFDWDDFADELDVSKKEAKKIVKHIEKIADTWRTAKVTAGYEMEVELIIKGSELDEPEESEDEVKVYKVNGKWISLEALGTALMSLPINE